MPDDWKNGGFGVYVHWPFCSAKCPYCDFNSHVRLKVDHERWRDALIVDISAASARLPGRRVQSIFFGGGTPSLMAPDTVAAVIEAIRRGWNTAPDVEITLEANPTSVEAHRLKDFRNCGVNRLSMGIQALDDHALKALGRMHSVREALAALELARGLFDSVSFDLIYARQHQSLDHWRRELRQALMLHPDHLSLYQLTIEEGTRFGQLNALGRLRGMPDDDIASDMYHLTQTLCEEAGLPAYEISNHAKPGKECRHNLLYWRYGDYAGIGPGAHGRETRDGERLATTTKLKPEEWLETVETTGHGIDSETSVQLASQAEEFILTGLRLTEGIDIRRYLSLGGKPLRNDKISELCSLGLLKRSDNRIAATASGRPLLNSVIFSILNQ